MSSKIVKNKKTKGTKQHDLNVNDIRDIYVRTGAEFKEPERTVFNFYFFSCFFDLF